MRLAIARYSGERGYTPEEFVAVASSVAGTDLTPLLHTLLATTNEMDYTEALDWFGLKFADPGSADSKRAWALEPRPDATPSQQAHFCRSNRRRWRATPASPVARVAAAFAS